MKIFTKTALACALAAGAVMASADTVEIRDGNGQVHVTYSADAVTVQGGVITISNGTYVTGQLPGTGGPGVTCDPNTTEIQNGVCVGTSGGGADCGPGTELNENLGQCVPATPPTLNISSSPTSMGDGVSTATLTFQFSRDVTGFTQSDINVNPTAHNISGFTAVDGDTFRATLNRSGNNSGSVTVSVSANSYQGTNGANGGGDSHSITLVGGTTTVGNCEVPAGVEVSNVAALTSLGTSGGQIDFTIPQNGVLSAPVSTGNNPNYAAMFEMVGHYTVQSLSRKMWISDCPGGAPVSSCAQKVGADLTWRWTQGANYWGYCALQTNKDYYLNVQMISTCPYVGGCRATTQHKSNHNQNL